MLSFRDIRGNGMDYYNVFNARFNTKTVFSGAFSTSNKKISELSASDFVVYKPELNVFIFNGKELNQDNSSNYIPINFDNVIKDELDSLKSDSENIHDCYLLEAQLNKFKESIEKGLLDLKNIINEKSN